MIIKCKMCGGDIDFTPGATYGTCAYCGSVSTIPQSEDENKLNRYNRANHFRRQGEFDKALAAYEKLLELDETDAEAHWGIVISRYGIEYVEDPASGQRVPTCHRMQVASILADADYLAAMEHAPDEESKRIYQTEAQRIAEIQKSILAISVNEQPYDVFICYKETDDNGQRTHDSQWAQDVYYGLTEQGYKVFFSRITLEDKLGQQYEPYIFAALNSAKVMVVIGSKPEYFNAVWVKNEWSRYLALMAKDRKRLLIPCYRGMDPYDLPDELSVLQSQDMGKIGFMQDLLRGVKKVLDADKKAEQPKAVRQVMQTGPATNAASPSVSSLMDRAYLFLEDGDFESVSEYVNRVLDIDPKFAPAYVAKICVALQLRKESDLQSTLEVFETSSDWQKAIRFANPDQKRTYEKYAELSRERREENKKLNIYRNAIQQLNSAKTPEECQTAQNAFRSISGYRDSNEKQEECARKAQSIIEEQKRKREEEEKRKRKEEKERKREIMRRKKQNLLASAIVIVVVVLIAIYITIIQPAIKYNNTFNTAKSQVTSGNYWSALQTLDSINDHQEVQDYIATSSVLQNELARIAQYDEGKTIIWGHYEQDNNTANGKEPIEWLIIASDGGRRLLLSTKVLDYQPFNTEEIHSRSFSGSYLEHWLQNDFRNMAFSEYENSRITAPSLLEDISLLWRVTNGQLKATPTEYARALGSDGTWYLSSLGSFILRLSDYQYSKVVTANGRVSENGPAIWNMVLKKPPYWPKKSGVRPITWIDITYPLQ